MRVRLLAFAAAGLGAMALAGCGSTQTLTIQPAANTAPAPAANTARCDTGAWTGVYDPNGRPDAFDAGDRGAVYVWHDADGWHLRATDQRRTDHHYTGTVRLTSKARFTNVRPVRDEKDDRVWVDGGNVLHYDFHTFASIDGVDFTISCRDGGQEREGLRLSTRYDGSPAPDRVRIGDLKLVPASAEFGFHRAV